MNRNFKKFVAAGVSAFVLATSVYAFAEGPDLLIAPYPTGNETMPIAPNPTGDETMPIAPISAKVPTALVVNGTSLEGAEIVAEGDVLMLPLRAVCEALGFSVAWNEEDSSIKIDNGEVNTTVVIGVDSYYKASSKAIGLTAPFSFGAAPMLINDKTYIPAELLNLLFSNPEIVTVDGDTMTVNTK